MTPPPLATALSERVSTIANWIDPDGIVFHNSDSPAHYGRYRVDAAYLNDMHHRDHRTWGVRFEGKTYYIGYHYVILPDGTVEKGRPDHCQGAHAKHFNHYLGICLIGDFETDRHSHWWPTRPTPEQLRSVVGLTERLMSEYHIPPERIKRHGDVENTLCPGRRFPYEGIMETLRAYSASHPETRSANPIIASLNGPAAAAAQSAHS